MRITAEVGFLNENDVFSMQPAPAEESGEMAPTQTAAPAVGLGNQAAEGEATPAQAEMAQDPTAEGEATEEPMAEMSTDNAMADQPPTVDEILDTFPLYNRDNVVVLVLSNVDHIVYLENIGDIDNAIPRYRDQNIIVDGVVDELAEGGFILGGGGLFGGTQAFVSSQEAAVEPGQNVQVAGRVTERRPDDDLFVIEASNVFQTE